MNNKKKIAFFVLPKRDAFINYIIDALSEKYEIKKIVPRHYNQIDEAMKWGDVCWFEWCDELIVYGSNLEIAKDKKLICRLHSYEAFTNNILKVNWENVDTTIFVGENIRDIVLNKVNIKKEKTRVIPNGVNIQNYTYKERKPGFNIAYLGYINNKKGPMLLLHTFKAIYEKDNRYKLYIAGQFQEERYLLYFKYMIKEMKLENNVIFDGWQNNVDKWLDDKNYIMCTSPLESQNMSVMQAMSKGIKPIVHNFVGAKQIYCNEYTWNTIDEAVSMVISNVYESNKYRAFVEDRYLIQDKIKFIENEIISDADTNDNNNKFDYASYWNSRLNNKFDIEGVGYLGLGKIYNKYMYNIRLDILKYLVKKLYRNLQDKNILEFGPGIGVFTQYFYENNVKSYKAVDIAEKSVLELKNKYKDFDFIKGDICKIENYNENKYDLIFAADVLLHLVDENKYKATIRNMKKVLKNNGYIITFNPISLISTQSKSQHVSIRDINYVKKILDNEDLEVISILPVSFFMNYPFDKKLLNENEDLVEKVFYNILNTFSSSGISDKSKEEFAQYLSNLEKLCLINNDFGVSQKVLVIKNKNNIENIPSTSINDIWNIEEVKKYIKQKKINILNNVELNQNGIVTKIHNDIDKLINLKISSSDELIKVSQYKPLVTVGITNYNGKKYLDTCVKSFLNQTYSNIEIILVDDLSTDGSKEMIEEYEKNYNNIRGIYHKKNSGGASKGIQEIIKNAKGKYIQWIAVDDYAAKNEIEQFVEFLEENPNKDYVYSNLNIVYDNGNVANYGWNYKLYTPKQIVNKIFYQNSGVIPMNCLFRREFFIKNNLDWVVYKGNDFCADTLNSLVYIKHGLRYSHLDKGLVYYRIHSSSLSYNVESRVRSMVSVMDYIIENFSEEVYFSYINWSKCENRAQLKNYLLGSFFYTQVMTYISGNKIPTYIKGNITKQDIIKYVEGFVEQGMKYTEKSLQQGTTYYRQAQKLKEQYKEYLKNNGGE